MDRRRLSSSTERLQPRTHHHRRLRAFWNRSEVAMPWLVATFLIFYELTLSRTAFWYYYLNLIHSTFLCFSRNCPNLALIDQSTNQSIDQWKYHITTSKIPSIASYSILVYDATVSNNAHYCFVFHCWYQSKLLVHRASSRARIDQRFFVY